MIVFQLLPTIPSSFAMKRLNYSLYFLLDGQNRYFSNVIESPDRTCYQPLYVQNLQVHLK